MKNIDFVKYDLSFEEYEKETKLLAEELKKDNILLKCFKANNINLDVVESNAWLLKEWLEEVKLCEACKGLKGCKQNNKGLYPNLNYDSILTINYQACKYERDKQNKTAHLRNYLINQLPTKLESVSFEEIELVGEDASYGAVYDICTNKSANNEGLYLYGTMGSGKTYLAACACNEHARNGERVCFVHYPTFALEMANNAFKEEAKELMDSIMRAEFVVLDDIGAESVTEYNRDQVLLPILNYRYENEKCTWFTSNVDIDTLINHFSTSSRGTEDEMKALRIGERLVHMAESVLLNTRDRR